MSQWSINFSNAPASYYTHRLIEGLQECGLVQHVLKATRYRQGVRPSTLDVVLSNEEGLVQNLTYLPPVGNSDHVVLRFDIVCYARIAESSRTRLNYNRGDFRRLNELLRGTVWDVIEPTDPQRRYETFKSTLLRQAAQCIPKARPKGKRQNIYINREALRLTKNKSKLWRSYSITGDELNYARYVRCKNDLRRLTRNLRKDFERRLVADLKENPKGFWRYTSSRMKTRPGVENLRTANGGLTTSDGEKADILNRYLFQLSVHTRRPRPTHPQHSPR